MLPYGGISALEKSGLWDQKMWGVFPILSLNYVVSFIFTTLLGRTCCQPVLHTDKKTKAPKG